MKVVHGEIVVLNKLLKPFEYSWYFSIKQNVLELLLKSFHNIRGIINFDFDILSNYSTVKYHTSPWIMAGIYDIVLFFHPLRIGLFASRNQFSYQDLGNSYKILYLLLLLEYNNASKYSKACGGL